ncbi:MAG: nuclear transport factor 2 family protein [Actinomycetota bacterium]|nr:nuclear transport factor 2 family protein [Actinomycetota bacterium]
MQDKSEQVVKLGEEWAASELRADTASLGEILAEDFIGVGPRGFMLTREQWLYRHDSGNLTYETFEWDEVSVRVHKDAAVMIGRETARAVYEDGDVRHEIQDQFRATLVFVEEEGRWVLLSLHLSPIAGPPAGSRGANEPEGRA